MHYSQLPPDPQTGMLRPVPCAPACPPVYPSVYPSVQPVCPQDPCCAPPVFNSCNCCQPTACTSALYNQTTEELTVNDESAVPLTNVTTVGSDLTYDVNTGLITVNKAGVYLLYWNVLAETVAGDANAPLVFALENTAGQVYALSGNTYITAEEAPVPVTGFAVRQLAAGTNIGLYNRTGSTVRLTPVTSASGLSIAGSLAAVKLC